MLPDAAAEEAEVPFAVLASAEQVDEVPPERGLGDDCRRQLERLFQAVLGRHLDEERLGVGCADRFEQLTLDLLGRVRHVGVCRHAATR